MNKKKSIWSGVSVLIAAVLAIVAFVRSDTQIWLLTAAFTIWAIWVTAAFVFPYIQEQENEKRRAARRAAYDAQRQSLRALSVEEEDGFGPLLLRREGSASPALGCATPMWHPDTLLSNMRRSGG